jgi:4-hydroxyphenylpyruvate dioxygenase-like putative hemolysin
MIKLTTNYVFFEFLQRQRISQGRGEREKNIVRVLLCKG